MSSAPSQPPKPGITTNSTIADQLKKATEDYYNKLWLGHYHGVKDPGHSHGRDLVWCHTVTDNSLPLPDRLAPYAGAGMLNINSQYDYYVCQSIIDSFCRAIYHDPDKSNSWWHWYDRLNHDQKVLVTQNFQAYLAECNTAKPSITSHPNDLSITISKELIEAYTSGIRSECLETINFWHDWATRLDQEAKRQLGMALIKSYKINVTTPTVTAMTDAVSGAVPETREQYEARRKTLAETRVAQDLSDLAKTKEKAKAEAPEKHWSDHKPWPGAHGSHYMLRL